MIASVAQRAEHAASGDDDEQKSENRHALLPMEVGTAAVRLRVRTSGKGCGIGRIVGRDSRRPLYQSFFSESGSLFQLLRCGPRTLQSQPQPEAEHCETLLIEIQILSAAEAE